MTLPSGVSIGAARAQFHRVRARKKAGWSRTVALWTFTKCPECRALIDATGEDWRDHERWHRDQEPPPDQGPDGPVYEDYEDQGSPENGQDQ